jgi:hypothetical protein
MMFFNRIFQAICYAEMGRVEEAINVVHLLADQPPIDNDRRRVFPLVVCNIKIFEKIIFFTFI